MCGKSCGGCCGKRQIQGSISLTGEEKDLLVKLLNNTLFRIHDLVVADRILDMLDSTFPIKEE